MKILPLVMFAGCMHKVETHYDNTNIGDVALMWQITENLRYEVSPEVVGYERIGDFWRLDGKKGKGYYNEAGIRVFNPQGEEVSYFAQEGSFTLIRNDDGCEERYELNLDERSQSRYTIKGRCDLELGIDLSNGMLYSDIPGEFLPSIEERRRSIMFGEIDETDRIRTRSWLK